MKCTICGSNTFKEDYITIGNHTVQCNVCSQCNKLIHINCDPKEERIFEKEYKDRIYEKRKNELNNKFLVMDLRNIRRKRTMSISDIGNITGISEQRLYSIEREGINIRTSTLCKIAYSLKCDINELVYYISREEYDEKKHILIVD